MTFQAELDRDEPRFDYSETRSEPAWPRLTTANRALSVDAGTEFVRARMPARQPEPSSESPAQRRVIDLPPRHDDERAEQDERRLSRRAGLLRRGPLAFALVLPLVLATAVGGYLYWDYASRFQSTDDAFIAARNFSIAPKVSGYITAVPVTDNQHVAAGDVIARIDDRDYRIALDQAQAQVASAEAGIQNIDAQMNTQQEQINASQAQVDQAQASLVFAQQQNDRYEHLAQTGYGSVQNAQQYSSQLRQQTAALASAQASLKVAQRQLETLTAQRESAVANLAQAKA